MHPFLRDGKIVYDLWTPVLPSTKMTRERVIAVLLAPRKLAKLPLLDVCLSADYKLSLSQAQDDNVVYAYEVSSGYLYHESEIFNRYPKDSYGYSKNIISRLCKNKNNF